MEVDMRPFSATLDSLLTT
ncbi:hypothetical protein LINPERPRIM_LOCUS18644 [Linum perenne]